MPLIMAQVLEKDPATYSKERDGFLRDLQHFHETKGTPFKKPPTLGGREVDLYLLYTLVTAQGGWIKVNSKNIWPDFLQYFQLPSKCVNGSIALKQIYLRYLDRWEKIHFLGEEGDRGSDDDEESRHKRWSARSLHSVPLSYNYNQHNVNEANREFNHLSADLFKPSDYDRLALSLISPLPNEQDFAINVCTLLSNDGKHTLKVQKHPRLIDYLLAHAGVFHHESLRKLFLHHYNVIRSHPIHNFWHEIVEWRDMLHLVQPEKQSTTPKQGATPVKPKSPSETAPRVPVNGTDITETAKMEVEITVPPKIQRLFEINTDDANLFCLGRTLGTQDYLGQRVLQIATILRNLTFIDDNVAPLAQNRTFIRFALLCSSSTWSNLRNLGLDMLGNVAPEILVRDLHQDRLASALLVVVSKGLHAHDRFLCIAALDLINKLSQNELNEDVLMRSLEKTIYQRVCSFLTIHDVMLLIYTLECLYSLSSLGERSCNLIVNNHGVVDTLVSLVTVEGKSYGPKACIGMKLVETVSGGTGCPITSNATNAPQPMISTPIPSTITPAPTSVQEKKSQLKSQTQQQRKMATPPPVTNNPKNQQSAVANTPVRQIQVIPQRLVNVSQSPQKQPVPTVTALNPMPSPNPVMPVLVSQNQQALNPQQLIQQQHAHQQAIQENEHFALSWLRATYEPCSNSKINSQELYKHYINSCTKIGRRGVISPLHFPRCVRSVFGGTVGPNPMKLSHPNEAQFYDGIKVRSQPLFIPSTVPAASPSPQSSQPQTTPQKPPVAARKKAATQKQQPVIQQQTMATAHPVSSTSQQSPPASPLHHHHQQQTPNKEQTSSATPINELCPASPILKAQLSAPPKQREAVVAKTDISQVMAHPHLSQALLGSSTTTSSTNITNTTCVAPSNISSVTTSVAQASSSSLIKSLLANKVNDCMTTVSIQRTADCQNLAQVAERQQRLLAQQTVKPSISPPIKSESPPAQTIKLNGMRQLFSPTVNSTTNEQEIADPSVSSTTQFSNASKDKKEPPQPPPPPLVLLPNQIGPSLKVDNIEEDSNSVGNNSTASCTIGVGGVSSTEDLENSLTSFEGLLNGVPNLLNDDSNSKDSGGGMEILRNKPLRLADLLEKKVEKTPPIVLNGSINKDFKFSSKGLELVENHIEKALSREVETDTRGIKREASDGSKDAPETKKIALEMPVNGEISTNSSEPAASGEGAQPTSRVSTAAAKLFADFAADILEDEDEEQLMQESQVNNPVVVDQQPAIIQQNSVPQIMVDNTGQMLIATSQHRQIIVPQNTPATMTRPQTNNTVVQQQQQTVIVQNASQQRASIVLQPGNLPNSAGQILLPPNLQGQMQFVASTGQPGQYVLQAGGGTNYMVAQPQTAVVHGQPQTVLVAQTPQQQGTGAKTIIILQQQPGGAHQKVVMTPQGQQMVVTQVQRPVIHTSVANIVQTPSVIKANPSVSASTASIQVTTTNSNQVQHLTMPMAQEKPKQEDKPQIVKPKIIRDSITLFLCEWGECNISTKFKSANEVYLHACEAHCPNGNEEVVCQWDRCDNLKRKRFSLMTHLHDKHCNNESMRQSLLKRKQSSNNQSKNEPPTPLPVSNHPGYAPDAALHAIKRHALEFVNPKELQDDNEGPVTKSIRLTASLILRNLVIYSGNCRRYLKHYESHLANVALSNVESSRTVAQILYDMNEGSTLR